ncbi:unnamed protein product, partial [Rotaria magnacalcarata]
LGSSYTQIGTSYGLYVDKQYNVWVSEYSNHRVTKWTAGNTASGTRVAGGNGAGRASSQLNFPRGIFVSNISTVYIADHNNHRIQRCLSGTTLGTTVAGTG